jgi:hypothetical protein
VGRHRRDPNASSTPAPEVSIRTEADLRQCVLAVCVLEDVDLTPTEGGVLLPGERREILVPWTLIDTAVGTRDPLSVDARANVSRLLRLTGELDARDDSALREILRPLALPVGHPLHPGRAWVRSRVNGGTVHLGLGLLGVDGNPDAVTVPPRGLLELLGVDLTAAWDRAWRYLEDMGAVAADRLERDPLAPLRPMGDCDVLTLLGSAVFRGALVDADGVGVRAVAVPMRRRGWIDPDHVDAVFARTAAAATPSDARGFDRPMLVTIEGVWEAVDGGLEKAIEIALREERDSGEQRIGLSRYLRS